MKRTITVSASFGGKISTGQYENSSPFFAASEVIEVDYDMDAVADAFIRQRQKDLQEICVGNFEAEAVRAKLAKIRADRKDFRWYGDYPSVTSILGYDTDFVKSEDEMKQYAAQGTIIHAQVAHFVKTGEWKQPMELEGIGAEIFIIKTGSLGLSLDGWDFPAMVKKYKVTDMANGREVVSKKHAYGGTPDLSTCLLDGVKTLPDIKRTPDKVKNFQQMAAYEMAQRENGMEPNEQIAIFPINDKTEQGFSKPIVTKEIDKYFELFLYKRKEFQKVYGI